MQLAWAFTGVKSAKTKKNPNKAVNCLSGASFYTNPPLPVDSLCLTRSLARMSCWEHWLFYVKYSATTVDLALPR